jgi:hypothetical protein
MYTKFCVTVIATFFALTGWAQISSAAQDSLSSLSEKLAQQQLDAYNARNIDLFLLPYSDSVEVYEFGGKLLMKGKEQMRKGYADMFKKITNLHCKLVNRMVQGNVVIDQESVTGFGPQPFRAIAVYTIEKGKIQKVHFIQ